MKPADLSKDAIYIGADGQMRRIAICDFDQNGDLEQVMSVEIRLTDQGEPTVYGTNLWQTPDVFADWATEEYRPEVDS